MFKLEKGFWDDPVGIFDDLDETLGIVANSQNDDLVKVNSQNDRVNSQIASSK